MVTSFSSQEWAILELFEMLYATGKQASVMLKAILCQFRHFYIWGEANLILFSSQDRAILERVLFGEGLLDKKQNTFQEIQDYWCSTLSGYVCIRQISHVEL